ncbi:MAG: hypothetical protein MJE68_21455 [Proteobacteria bacterium]|nr:hypothetical protein [Pseudomonadota bacterium]
MVKSENVVGYIPRDISKYFTTFIKEGGNIECKITGVSRQQKVTMTKRKERLEIPCIYKLSTENKQNLKDIKKVLKRVDSSIVKIVTRW